MCAGPSAGVFRREQHVLEVQRPPPRRDAAPGIGRELGPPPVHGLLRRARQRVRLRRLEEREADLVGIRRAAVRQAVVGTSKPFLRDQSHNLTAAKRSTSTFAA